MLGEPLAVLHARCCMPVPAVLVECLLVLPSRRLADLEANTLAVIGRVTRGCCCPLMLTADAVPCRSWGTTSALALLGAAATAGPAALPSGAAVPMLLDSLQVWHTHNCGGACHLALPIPSLTACILIDCRACKCMLAAHNLFRPGNADCGTLYTAAVAFRPTTARTTRGRRMQGRPRQRPTTQTQPSPSHAIPTRS